MNVQGSALAPLPCQVQSGPEVHQQKGRRTPWITESYLVEPGTLYGNTSS